MKEVVLAAATITGSCALLYALYNLKKEARAKRSPQFKRKTKELKRKSRSNSFSKPINNKRSTVVTRLLVKSNSTGNLKTQLGIKKSQSTSSLDLSRETAPLEIKKKDLTLSEIVNLPVDKDTENISGSLQDLTNISDNISIKTSEDLPEMLTIPGKEEVPTSVIENGCQGDIQFMSDFQNFAVDSKIETSNSALPTKDIKTMQSDVNENLSNLISKLENCKIESSEKVNCNSMPLTDEGMEKDLIKNIALNINGILDSDEGSTQTPQNSVSSSKSSSPNRSKKPRKRENKKHQKEDHSKGKKSDSQKSFKVKQEPHKSLSLSPDQIYTSDLERELSQSPEQENHSLDSQSLISQASLDSGQGSLEVDRELLANYVMQDCAEQYELYEFNICQKLVGKLIGKKGTFLNKVKAATSTNIILIDNDSDRDLKICSMGGRKGDICQALQLIKEHLPSAVFPTLCLDQVNGPETLPGNHPLDKNLLNVAIPPGVLVDVYVSDVSNAVQLSVQQPHHPTYSALETLHTLMNINYSDGLSSPAVPAPIEPTTVCVVTMDGQWMRCQVLSHTEETAIILLLDFGGMFSVLLESLRQMRMDYMSLPFQASQCYLYGIQPPTEEGWTKEGHLALCELLKDGTTQVSVAAYSVDGLPFVNVYKRYFDQYVYINQQLVEMGHARWIMMHECSVLEADALSNAANEESDEAREDSCENATEERSCENNTEKRSCENVTEVAVEN